MAQANISVSALFAAISTAKEHTAAAEQRDDPHTACRFMDIGEALTSAAARTRAHTEVDREAHRKLAAEAAGVLIAHATRASPLNDHDLMRVAEDLRHLGERLLEQGLERAEAA